MDTSSFPTHSDKHIIYVSASITNASDEYLQFTQNFKQGLRDATSAFVIEWIEKDSPMKLDNFYARNLNNVKMCDIMIVLVDEPSIGVGIEIKEALVEKKKFICLHRDTSVVSRLLLSARDAFGFPIRKYRTLREAIEIASDFIAQQDKAQTA